MFIADFHIHSKYSRATSKDCVPEVLDLWARRKGLDLIGTGDFTHALWREELNEKLTPSGEDGLYVLKDEYRLSDEQAAAAGKPRFLVTGEISSIYKKNGKVRKVHSLILLPSLEAAKTLSRRLETVGNLHSDGRPILGLDSHDLLEITLEMVPDAIFIPAHIWTPHFSLFGEYSGFDDIHECYEDLTEHIHSLETGLSSDPPMNWRVSALDQYTLVSNSDAHSPAKLAREANLFDTELSYSQIAQALDKRSDGFLGTLEFFPEEGKYHYDGHRNCGVCQKPSETIAANGICPVCGRRITVGVLHRVEELADREEGFVLPAAKRFESLIPLREVVACSVGLGAASKKVEAQYFNMLHSLGPELYVLRQAPLEDIARNAGPVVAEGIRRLREKSVEVEPGYDGAYGKVKLFGQGELCLFSARSCVPDEPLQAIPNTTDLTGSLSVEQPNASGEGADCSAAQAHPYGLNQEQWDAVCAEDPAVAVVAGPGTGKTKTLIGRIAYLIETCGVSPDRITAVTFTNKAASEMRERLKRHFPNGQAAAEITIGTFHSICLQFLRGDKADAAVIDEQSTLGIMSDVLKQLGEKSAARAMLRAVSLIKSGAVPAEAAEVSPQVYGAYCAALDRAGAMDFDDILLRALKRFEADDFETPPCFEHVLVDEFQDINSVQYRLIRAWCKRGTDLFVIGDPDQSIYGFRGTDPRCFEKFFGDFPAARQIRLTKNYRSTPEILCCAQSVFAAEDAQERALCAVRSSGAKVRLLKADDAFSEALFIAKEINRMVGGMDMLQAHASPSSGEKTSKWGFGDIAVLYRTNRQANALEQCLLKEDIPYVVAGRHDFLSDPQVKKALSFFRFLLRPNDTAALKSYLKACALPAGKIGRIASDYASSGKKLSGLSVILKNTTPDLVSDLSLSAKTLSEYARAVKKQKPGALIERWARDNALTGEQSMELLINTSVTYDDMSSFLESLTLGQERDVTRSGRRNYSPDAVSLLTLHCSKGLEYPVVFLCGVSDGLIPFRSHSGECDLDEERRLFFVGMTRAQDELVLLRSPAGSPFLSDLPKEDLMMGDALPSKPKPTSKQLSLF